MYLLKPSFAGGEISPALYGRTDFAKYDNGAAQLLNFIVQRYGGVANRAGTKFIAKCPGFSVLRPFKYSSRENYMIEFSEHRIRIFSADKELIGDIIHSPYTANDLRLIKYTQSADVLFLVHPNHPPMTLTRYSHTNWELEEMDNKDGPFEDTNTTDISISASGTTGQITITSDKAYFGIDMLGNNLRLGHTVGSQYVKGVPGTDELKVKCVPGGTVYVESFGFWEGNFSLEEYVDGQWTKIRTQNGNHSSNYNFTETNNHSEIVEYRITSTKFDLTIWEGENNKQKGHVTLQTFAQDYYGIVKIININSGYSADCVVVKQLGDTNPTKDFSFGPWSDLKGYPMCAGFFEDRLVYAGSKLYGQTFWMSKSGDYYNFGTSIPGADTDAITGTLNGGQMNGIKAMVAYGELVLMTAGGEHKVTGVNQGAVAPGKTRSQAQEYRGISDVSPVTVGSRIVYIQQQGNIVRDLAYAYESDKYTGDDLNLLAGHLFERHKLVSMTYQQTPNSIVWIVRDDGLLLGLTYLKEQDIYAWHQHTTLDGAFIDVASIAGEKEDELWCVVKRGDDYFIEVMAERDRSKDVADQYFVDCGVQVESEAGISVVTGLEHLEGKTVSILADGFVLPQQQVVGGAVNIKYAYHKVSVGLPIESVLETLPLEVTGQDGSTISRRKRVNKLLLMFKDSSGGRYGFSESKLDEIKWRSTESYGVAIQLYSGKQEILMPGASYEKTVQVTVQQNDPLPLTILSIVPEMQVGG